MRWSWWKKMCCSWNSIFPYRRFLSEPLRFERNVKTPFQDIYIREKLVYNKHVFRKKEDIMKSVQNDMTVGSPGTIMFLIYGFVVGMTAGFTVLTAQKFGAGDMQGMRRTVAGAGILSFLIGLFLTVTFMLFMKPLLHLMHTPSDIFADAYKYIMIVSGGILAQMLYNLLSSILRALGNSKIPLYFLIISALLTIVLDLVLIIVFQMGAPGAAIATVVAQGISGVLCLIYIICGRFRFFI